MEPPKTAQTKKNATVSVPQVAEVTTPSPDRILINELEGANDEIRTIAQQIRAVDYTMGTIEKNLQQMTASLEEIVKQYPPYLQNNEERITALRQFGGLRQLIDQLTMPPPDDSPSKILGDKKRFAEAGDWELTIAKDQPPVIIRHQPVHSGVDGLNLPALATDASDQLVHKALGKMSSSYAALQRKRQGFAADANRAMAAIS
ncbi:MAG: hypothetical protein WAU91_21775 [Desulfatitalea sp.]